MLGFKEPWIVSFRRTYQRNAVCARLSGVDELVGVHLDGFIRLERRLGLQSVPHVEQYFGGTERFKFGPGRGEIRGFECQSVPWVAKAEIRKEGDEFVRTRILGLTAVDSIVPHLDISINATVDGTMLRIDMIPRMDLVHDLYLEKYYGEGPQAMWQDITQKANAVSL